MNLLVSCDLWQSRGAPTRTKTATESFQMLLQRSQSIINSTSLNGTNTKDSNFSFISRIFIVFSSFFSIKTLAAIFNKTAKGRRSHSSSNQNLSGGPRASCGRVLGCAASIRKWSTVLHLWEVFSQILKCVRVYAQTYTRTHTHVFMLSCGRS